MTVLFFMFVLGNVFAQEVKEKEFSEWGAFGVNMIIGLGLGSFAQGDEIGGTIALCGELTGITLIAVAALWEEPDTSGKFEPNLKLMIPGLAVWLGSRVFSIFRPLNYAKTQANKPDLMILPTLDNQGNLAMATVFRFRF
jgi:hypothetical protein